MKIKPYLRKHFPFLGNVKRHIISFADAFLPAKKSYSQNGEDIFFLEMIKKYNINSDKSLYIDAGAFLPSKISNTFLLYRNGFHGVLIEPNYKLYSLLRKYRKRDVVINSAAGNENCVMNFSIADTPDGSSLVKLQKVNYNSDVLVPILRIDDIIKKIVCESIMLFSIDAEGFNFEVLKGAKETLKKTFLVCVEFDENTDKAEYETLLGEDFEYIETFRCNLVFKNKMFTC